MMPSDVIPPGWRAILLGSAGAEDMSAFIPLEESLPEGALLLARLDLADYPLTDSIDRINQSLAEAGVEIWPGASYYVFITSEAPSLYIAWSKGMVWWGIILAVLGTVLLPPLLTSVVWWILPEEIKTMIESLAMMGVMMLLMFVMTKFIKPLGSQPKAKELKEAGR
ncbi:hypothetical protein ACFLY3_00570 [Chloroflexota bacterium]